MLSEYGNTVSEHAMMEKLILDSVKECALVVDYLKIIPDNFYRE
ncbi:MAG: hypothetical protein AB1798_00575 [Spirochaetota bacterium]